MDGPSTRSVHADRQRSELPDVAPAIRPSTTFADGTGRRYRRSSHETTERLEAVIGSLERGHAVAYASGMAAATAVLDHIEPNRIWLPDDCYHGVRQLVEHRADAGRWEITDADELDAGDVMWVETPSNPFCTVTDLTSVATRAHVRGSVVVCDSTFATPLGQQPLDLGADFVLHSATKALSGHSDALAGLLVSADAEVADRLRCQRTLTGSVPGSLDVWLVLRGVRTLALRFERGASSAARLAAWFHDRGVDTYYPGLPDHPQHDVARRQMTSYGSVFTVDFDSDEVARSFVAGLRLFTEATSLGGVESLVEQRHRSDAAIGKGVVRFSVGVEDLDDLMRDVGRAYDLAGPVGQSS